MSKLLGRNFWICMLAMTAVACGGGGGGDNNGPVIDPNAPDAVAQRLTVTNPNTQVVTGAAPKSTATENAPEVTSAGDALRTASAGDEVTIDLNILSLNGVSSLLARVTAATSYVEVADPDVTPTGGTAKAVGGSNFSGTLRLQLGSQLTADQFCFEIAAVDELGQVSNYRKVCFDIPNNRPAGTAAKPRVNAGGDQTVNQGATVTLSGTAERSGGSITNYTWTQLTGTSVTLSGTGSEVSFDAPDVTGTETFKFQLEVTADDGQKVRDTTEVTIIDTDVNTAPTVRAGDDRTVNEGATVNLRGFVSDTDGTVSSLLWESSNSAVQLTSTSTRATSFVAPAVGRNGTTVTLTLTATDDDAATGSDSLTVTIANVNNVPVASDGSLSTLKNEATEGNLYNYASDADAEDSDNLSFAITDTVSSGTLTLGDNGAFTYTPATDFTGSVSFTYSASDGLGSDTGTITILVQDQIGTNGGAGKGVIGGASITASEITAGGQVSRGTSTTASDGDYELVLTDYNGGPLLISLNGGNGATMRCDVAAGCNGATFGSDVLLPDTFQMQVLLPSVASSEDLASCISPFTHLAAQRAIEVAGSLDAVTTAIAREALSEVGSLLAGIDVLRTCVIDTTVLRGRSPHSNKDITLSALSAAVLAVQGATDPTAALATLVADFAGGEIAASKLQALVSAARDELQALNESDASGVLAAMQLAVNNAGAGNVNPEPNATAGDSAVEQGKALIAGIRNLGRSLFEDSEGYSEFDTSHPANLFSDRIIAANDELLFEAVNAALVRAYDEADAFYNRNPAQPGQPGTSTISSTDGNDQAQSATITITNEANDVHQVTVVGQVGDVILDWTVRSPTSKGTEGNRPSGNLAGTIVATAQTANSASAGFALEVNGTIAVNGLNIAQRTINTPAVPSPTIVVDGSRGDWSGATILTDPQGDHNGSSAADIIEYAVSVDSNNDQVSLLVVMADDLAFPHTPGEYSIYGAEVDVYRESGCRGYGGEIYMSDDTSGDGGFRSEQFFVDTDNFFGNDQVDVATSGSVLEFGFDSSHLAGFEAISISVYNLAGFDDDDVDNNDVDNPERLDANICFNLNGAGSHQEEVYRGGDIAFDLDFEFRQTDESNPLIMAGDLSFAFSNCANCEQLAGNDLINFGHFRVEAELFDENRDNGARFFFEVDFDDTAEDNFNPLLEIGPDNVPAADFTLAFDAALDGLAYEVTIAGEFRDIIEVVDDPIGGGDFTEVDAELTIRIGRGGRYMELVASPPTVVNDSVVISASFGNQDGVELRFEFTETAGSDEVVGEVYVGSTKVGDLEETDGGVSLIRWIDGSFESLG